MMHYQKEVRALCKVPCFVSALLQAALLVSLFAADEEVLVLTANGAALDAHLPSLYPRTVSNPRLAASSPCAHRRFERRGG